MFWVCFCRSFFFPLLWFDEYLEYCVWIAFLLFMYISVIDFWLVVIIRFWYSNLYVSKVVLCYWSLNFKSISNIPHLYPPLLMIAAFVYLCVNDFLLLLYFYPKQWTFLLVIFFFLVVTFSFPHREVFFTLITKLVQWC